MISFEPSEEQQVVREAMHEFAEQVLRPASREADEASALPDAVLAQLHELGLVATQLPEAFGGGGEQRSPLTNAILLDELAWGDAAFAMAALAPAAFAFAVADQGTQDQQAEWLPRFCGEKPYAAALALVEPSPLFDVNRLRTIAEPKGDDGFVLSGAKSCVPLGDRAEAFLVIARNNGARDAFILPRDAAGLSISETEKNLGLKALPTVTLELERVEVPAAARLGGSDGCDVQQLVDRARVAKAAVLTGLSRAVLDYSVPYAKDRRAFDQAIAQKQAIAFRIADMRIEIDAQRWLSWKAAADLEYGRPATKSAHHAGAYAAEKAMWIADNGVQVLGGHGFIREHPVELWYRNARTLGVLEGMLSV
ncbi:MAG: acyl-CoA dehydrogenase family protein [Deltaproteobacteria bacterium]|nr:acyl-CoA dehydrogenase family protein [Deltaproteobacteria bacterium]